MDDNEGIINFCFNGANLMIFFQIAKSWQKMIKNIRKVVGFSEKMRKFALSNKFLIQINTF